MSDGAGPTDVAAAIDCGTNSIRLLVARRDGDRLIDLDRRMTVVRLGEGVDATGELSPAALQRTFAACRDYAAVLQQLGVRRLRFAATSASRDARNADEFLAGVRDILGTEPRVIPGHVEAQLSYVGATRSLTGIVEPALVFDIGGGSTEFVLGADGAGGSCSVALGCVRFFERYLTPGPATAVERAALQAGIDAALDDAVAALDLAGHQPRTVVGLAGTVTTVAALALGLAEYDSAAIHGARVSATDVSRIAADLLAMSADERSAFGVMHPGRADVIAAGAAILATILRRVDATEVIASEHDILDGLVWSQLEPR